MNVSSYIFQSPYSQPFQVGRPDPSSSKTEEKREENTILEPQKQSNLADGKLKPTMGEGVNISLSVLQSANEQRGVSEFKSLVNVNQGLKAYSEAS